MIPVIIAVAIQCFIPSQVSCNKEGCFIVESHYAECGETIGDTTTYITDGECFGYMCEENGFTKFEFETGDRYFKKIGESDEVY